MISFIDSVTQHISSSSRPIEDWVIVVPSQRAIRYLQKSLFNHFGHSLFSPKILTITQLVDEVSPRIILDKTRLLFKLYEVYLKESKEKSSFDEFYTWGKIVLSDFDEIESYLVNGKDLFKNLKDVKEIENWSFNSEELTPTQLKFIEFWDQLGHYYQHFSTFLQKNNETYRGWATKEVSENIDWITRHFPNQKIVFAGFNAHSKVELSLIKQLYHLGKAEVLFDADDYYMNDSHHEAGSFIRSNLEFIGIPKKEWKFKNQLSEKPLNIQLIGCSQTTGQIKAAATLLASFQQEEINDTLVLLADENLLVPLLKNIPATVGSANITLGLSLNNSILKTWFELIFRIQKGLKQKPVAYHKDIFEIGYHPFINEILDEKEQREFADFERNFKRNNTIYANPQKLKVPDKLYRIIQLIYTPWLDNWKDAIQRIREINRIIYELLQSKNEYEKSLLETFDSGIIDFVNCLSEKLPDFSLGTFKNLFTEHYSRLKIAYFGNPLKGMQIMGLLETRMLDFKRIICIGMNEKNMPPNNAIQSMIPMDLRRYFGMPTIRDKQGLFAHHFYRLLHQAETIFVTFANQQEGENSFEKSRYIMQLEMELAHKNPNVSIQYSDYVIDNETSNVQDVTYATSQPDNHQLLLNYLQHGASASGIKNFYTCKLDFFYKYILKYRDEQKIEEEIDNSTFGTLIHNTLEGMYTRFANHQLEQRKEVLTAFREENLLEMKQHSEYELRKEFTEFFKDGEVFQAGKNRLNFEMAKTLLANFFDYELQKMRQAGGVIYVENLEHELQHSLPEIITGADTPLKIKGFIDRIDYYNDGFHIIDYKSGKVDFKKDLFISEKNINPEKIYEACVKKKYFIQFYFYLYLFYSTYHIVPKSITFIPFINPKDTTPIFNENEKFEQLIEYFPTIMKRIVSDILNKTTPIQHNPKSLYCNFC